MRWQVAWAPLASFTSVYSARARAKISGVVEVWKIEGSCGWYATLPVSTNVPPKDEYVDRILRGARPGDLPVQLPTKYEFVINAKTAKALGLSITQSVLSLADELIQ